MSTFMLLALLCAFLLGMTAGAWLCDITMRANDRPLARKSRRTAG
jgi:hypothetical protein